MKDSTRRQRAIAGCLALSVMFGGDTALAQSPPSSGKPSPPTATSPAPQPCAEPRLQTRPGNEGQPPTVVPGAPATAGQGPSLSDQLAQGEGVLCPPKGVDAEIVAPTPNVGRMPVIPPPGSPGGDPTVRPK